MGDKGDGVPSPGGRTGYALLLFRFGQGPSFFLSSRRFYRCAITFWTIQRDGGHLLRIDTFHPLA